MAHFIHLIFLDQYLSKSFDVPYQWDMKIAIKKFFFMFLCAFELSINICSIMFHYICIYTEYTNRMCEYIKDYISKNYFCLIHFACFIFK